MEKKEAIGIISQVCSVFKGTIQEHNVIQEALKYLSVLAEAPKVAPPVAPPVKKEVKAEVKKE